MPPHSGGACAVLFVFMAFFVLQQSAAIAEDPRRPFERSNGGMLMPASSANQSVPTKAIRFIFEYDGDQVRLVSQQPVEVAITGADIAQAESPGFYLDTRDKTERTLARVAARGAFSSSAEVFPEQPGEPILRVDVAQPKGAFTVVVPTPTGADHVTVVRITPGTAGAPQPLAGATSRLATQPQVTDLASFPLTPNP
jgi:hypothetical protein